MSNLHEKRIQTVPEQWPFYDPFEGKTQRAIGLIRNLFAKLLQHLPILQPLEDIPWSGQDIFIEYLHSLFKAEYDYTTIHNSSTGDIIGYCSDSH